MATTTSLYMSSPSVRLVQLEGQNEPTLSSKFWDQTNSTYVTVLIFVKDGKLHIKLPKLDCALADRVQYRILNQLYAMGIAVCDYVREEMTVDKDGKTKKTVIVNPSSEVVAKNLPPFDPTTKGHKLGFVANKLPKNTVVALMQNGTISILGKGLPFALALMAAMFPSLSDLNVEGLRKQMLGKKDAVVEEFPPLNVAISTATDPAPAKLAPWKASVTASEFVPAVVTAVVQEVPVVPAVVTAVVPAVEKQVGHVVDAKEEAIKQLCLEMVALKRRKELEVDTITNANKAIESSKASISLIDLQIAEVMKKILESA